MPVKPVISPGPGLLVQALGVALLAQLDRRVDEHLDERQAGRRVQRPHQVAVGPVRADQRHEGDDAGVGQQAGHVPDPADVLGPVGGGEPEVAVEAEAEVVAVEHVGRAAGRRPAAARTAAATVDFPDPDSPVSHTVAPGDGPVRPGDLARVPGDVVGHDVDRRWDRGSSRRPPWCGTASSTRMKLPVVRLRRYSSKNSGCVVRSVTRPISLSERPTASS